MEVCVTDRSDLDALMMSLAADALMDEVDTYLERGHVAFSIALEACLGTRVDIVVLGQRLVTMVVYGAASLPPVEAVNCLRSAVHERGLRAAAILISPTRRSAVGNQPGLRR